MSTVMCNERNMKYNFRLINKELSFDINVIKDTMKTLKRKKLIKKI